MRPQPTPPNAPRLPFIHAGTRGRGGLFATLLFPVALLAGPHPPVGAPMGASGQVASSALGAPASEAAADKTIKGTIDDIDASIRTFDLLADKSVHTIKYSVDTKFKLDGKKSTAKTALSKGRSAKVKQHGDVVRSVHVSSKP